MFKKKKLFKHYVNTASFAKNNLLIEFNKKVQLIINVLCTESKLLLSLPKHCVYK